MAEGVPDDLVFNADEIFAEVGVPAKVLVPSNEKIEPYINDFDQNSHVTAMVTINAAGDMFPLFMILPLMYLQKNLSPMVLRRQMNIGGVKVDI